MKRSIRRRQQRRAARDRMRIRGYHQLPAPLRAIAYRLGVVLEVVKISKSAVHDMYFISSADYIAIKTVWEMRKEKR